MIGRIAGCLGRTRGVALPAWESALVLEEGEKERHVEVEAKSGRSEFVGFEKLQWLFVRRNLAGG